MAKEKFNWKGLFINEEGEVNDSKPEAVESKPASSSNSFPKSSSKSTSSFPNTNPASVSNTVLGSIVSMYESGFDSLNKPGYDFYEFFKAIKAVGSNDASVYKMALSMAQGVDSKVTKSKLLTQADYYIKEIEKVHKNYENQGNAKKASIQSNQNTNKKNLTIEISDLEKQLINLQNQISNKKNQLQSGDTNLMSEVAGIDQKIVANDMARTKILETINTVVEGIKNNI